MSRNSPDTVSVITVSTQQTETTAAIHSRILKQEEIFSRNSTANAVSKRTCSNRVSSAPFSRIRTTSVDNFGLQVHHTRLSSRGANSSQLNTSSSSNEKPRSSSTGANLRGCSYRSTTPRRHVTSNAKSPSFTSGVTNLSSSLPARPSSASKTSASSPSSYSRFKAKPGIRGSRLFQDHVEEDLGFSFEEEDVFS